MLRILIIVSFGLFIGIGSAIAQQAVSCSNVKFESRNQVEPNPLDVHWIAGRVIDTPKVGNGQPISSVCVVLFYEATKKRIAVLEPDENGNFNFKAVKDGIYRLVVKDKYGVGFCLASIPIRVRSTSSERRLIVVHMLMFPPIDRCSYGDLQELPRSQGEKDPGSRRSP